MKKIFFIICLFFSFEVFAQTSKIQAVVNGEIITTSDLSDRLKNLLFVSRMPLNQETEPMIKQQVLHQAIDETLKVYEAEKNGIKVDEKDINNAVKRFEDKNGKIDEEKISERALRAQIKADIAWSKLMGVKAYEARNVTQKEAEDALALAMKDINSPKRMISEIYILKNKAKNISELVKLLRTDSRFELYAQQFSDAPSAGRGGKLGWVNVGRFDEPLENALSKMKEGEISDPISSGNGYYILRLEKNFNPETEKTYIPTMEEMKSFLQNKKMDMFTQDYSQKMRQNAVVELR